jgi:hypothetical protein
MTTQVMGSTTAKPEPPAAWIPDDGSFGARLALIRQRMGWGNVKLAAEACGVPPESWRTWERDGVEPRGLTRIARQISERTGCDYGWLLDGPALAGRGPERVITPKPKQAERSSMRAPKNNRPKTRQPDSGLRLRTKRVSRPTTQS